MPTSTELTYGTTIFLKNQGDTNSGRWLTGCRGTGNHAVRTSNRHAEGDKVKTYQWQLWQRWDSIGSGTVQSGDHVLLKCLFTQDRWLTGGRGAGNVGVRTEDGENQFGTSYEWKLLLNADDESGRPIYLNDAIFLGVGVVGNPALYLTGGRGSGNHEVRTQNFIDKPSTFHWKIEAV